MTTNSNELVFHQTKTEEDVSTQNLFQNSNKNIPSQQQKKITYMANQRKQNRRLGRTHHHTKFNSRHSLLSLRSNIILVSFAFILYFTYNQYSVEACLCHLIPNFQCPPPPHCCESGQYAKDQCGCCLTCAKSELQPCGGPSGDHGKCSDGLQCLKTCTACTTLASSNPEPCVFPFVYDNVEYNQCTSVDAANPGTVWCATEVDPDYNNTVIDGRWGDCASSCPGARRPCNDKRFEIIVGECINPQVPGAIPNWFGAPAFRLLEPTEQLFPAPFCSKGGKSTKRRPKYKDTCHCAEGQDAFEITTDGTVRGNCTGVDNNRRDDHDPVWCFLENVRDPANSASGCYHDTTWSAKDGRFWSARACDGLPPVDGREFDEVDPSELVRSAFNTPFQRPVISRATTRRPRTTTTRRPRPTTSRRPLTTTTNLASDFEEFNTPSQDEDLADNLVANNRLNFRKRVRLNDRPTTEKPEEDYIDDYEESSDVETFGARHTTPRGSDLQTVEDDYGEGNGDDYPEEDRSSRVFEGGPAIVNIDYNDADLEYLYDYYNEGDYEDKLSPIRGGNHQQRGQGSGIKATSNFPNNKDSRIGEKHEFLIDLPIVNQRENGVEFFPTPTTTNNKRKSTTLRAR